MEGTEKNRVGRGIDRLFGRMKMTWPVVLLYAVASAILTVLFLTVPVFKNTSFERMGVTLEAWIFLAVVIMTNCRKPLESAVKTFVFFLVSQPLIYLLQVPFSPLGWQLFQFYRYWFIWTLLTFPMAFAGWYLTKKNWLSVLILAPVLAFLGATAFQCGRECLHEFPHLFVTVLFCLMQIILYVVAFMPDWRKKAAGLLIPVIAAAVIAFTSQQLNLTVFETLPGNPAFSDNAEITVVDSSVANVQLHSAETGVFYIHVQKYGSTELIVADGGKEYRYTVEVIRDPAGAAQVRITQLE